MNTQVSEQHLYVAPRKVHEFHNEIKNVDLGRKVPNELLKKVGFGFDSQEELAAMYHAHCSAKSGIAMDMDVYPTQTTPSAVSPLQFLQEWLPGYIYYLTTPRMIDELVGIATVGNWRDEKIVRTYVERTGNARPYSDESNVPFANWNTQYDARTIVRFEDGIRIGRLVTERAAAVNISNSKIAREACLNALEDIRNLVGFYGYLDGAGGTYGFLNDPKLPNFITVPAGASGGTTWAEKTFLEIQNDLLTLFQALMTQSKGRIDPQRVACTLALPVSVKQYLSTTSDFGISVLNWLETNYPKLRILAVPQLDGAFGGANVFYIYADNVNDDSTDGGATFYQAVPTKMMTVGVEQQVKAYIESYTNATAGVMLQRSYAVVRGSGI